MSEPAKGLNNFISSSSYNSPMPPILYLIDGHALAYRSYFALTKGQPTGRWITSSGEQTAGVYGFTSVLLRILEQENPDYLAVVFDTGKTFRDDIYPDYKDSDLNNGLPDYIKTCFIGDCVMQFEVAIEYLKKHGVIE